MNPAVLITIPLVTAFIGFVTNWAAVKMIFYPLHFVGVGPIGWQGVLPRRSDTFARDVAATMEEKILSTRELVERIDPDELEAIFEQRLTDQAPQLIAAAADIVRPGAWDELPEQVREAIVAQAVVETRATARDVFTRLQGISDELLDLRSMVVGLLTGENTARLVRLFQEIGGPELKWIEWYGAIFGFLVGCLQVAAYGVADEWWLMPIVGGVVGLGTNWLALQMIFRPQEPRRILGVRWQGLFPKRQAEIAHDYGRIAASEILTPENLLRLITEGPAGGRVAGVVLEVVSERIDAQRPVVEAMVQAPVTDDHLARVKALLIERVSAELPHVKGELEAYLERALDVANLVEGRLRSLSKPEFERLLRGIFEQDEWILIAIGGALGLAVGFLQGGIVVLAGG